MNESKLSLTKAGKKLEATTGFGQMTAARYRSAAREGLAPAHAQVVNQERKQSARQALWVGYMLKFYSASAAVHLDRQ